MSSDLDQLMEQIRSKYDVEVIPLKIGDRTLQVVQLKDFDEYVERLVDTQSPSVMDMPFWAKLWEAGFVLSCFMAKQPVVEGQRILEIGAGIGVVGIYAALCGHRVTITDINEDALLFAQANKLLNGATLAEVSRLDWNDGHLIAPYDVIIGSEVIYDRRSYPLLVQFLRRALKPEGMIFFAKHEELKTPTFFSELTQYFEFKQTVQTIRSGVETQRIGLFAIRPKQERE